MADFYGNLAAVATRLLTSKGQSITFSREVQSAFNPTTGVATTSTTTFSGYGAAFDYNSSEIDGEIIQKGDIRLVLEATATAPIIGDTCTIDSDAYRAMNVKPTSPAGTPVIYEVQLRR